MPTQAIFYIPPTEDTLDTSGIEHFHDLYESSFFSKGAFDFYYSYKHHSLISIISALELHRQARAKG